MATRSKSKSVRFTPIHASSKVFQSSNLLLAIVQYLPPLDCGRACIVNRHWNETIDRCHEIWKRHIVKRWPDCKDVVNGMRVTRRGMTAKEFFCHMSMSFPIRRKKKMKGKSNEKDKAASPRVVEDEFKDVFMRIQVEDERDGRRIASAFIPLDNERNLEGLFLDKTVSLRLSKGRKKAPLPDPKHWKAAAAILDLSRNFGGTAIEANNYEWIDDYDAADDLWGNIYWPQESGKGMETAYEEFGYCHYLRLYAELREVYDEDGEVDEDAESELMNMRVSIRTVAEQRSFGCDVEVVEFRGIDDVMNHLRNALKDLWSACRGNR